MTASDYAMIKDGDTEVLNTIVAEENFTLDGYYFVKIEPGEFVTIGMKYDNKSGKFS